jgi:hypothetical protein
MTSVEVMNSTWNTKQTQQWFSARFVQRPAGHWVTFTTAVARVNFIAFVYAWSHHGITYILSTCRSTEPSGKMFTSYLGDDVGNIASIEIQWPTGNFGFSCLQLLLGCALWICTVYTILYAPRINTNWIFCSC